MKTNKTIVDFNTSQIENNTKLLDDKKFGKNFSKSDIEKEINSNKLLIIQIQSVLDSLSEKIEKIFNKSSENHENLVNNKNKIYERRNEILENLKSIERNKERIEKLLQ